MRRVALSALGGRGPVLALVAACVAWSASSRAATTSEAVDASRCLVTVGPPGADAGWRTAARRLQERLDSAGAEVDCEAIRLEVAPDRTFLIFTTRDGRQTVRRLESARELGPAVDALLVTVEAPAQPSAQPNAPPNPVPVLERPRPPAPRAAVRVLLGAAAGVRASEPGDFVSPAFGAAISIAVGRVEVAVVGQWDPAHLVWSGSPPADFAMSRYAVGVAAGGRLSAGRGLCALGASAMVAVVNEHASVIRNQTTQEGTSLTTVDVSTAEPLGGLYAAFIYPADTPLRARATLAADAVVSRIGQSGGLDPALPPLPWWSASASVGAEWEVP